MRIEHDVAVELENESKCLTFMGKALVGLRGVIWKDFLGMT